MEAQPCKHWGTPCPQTHPFCHRPWGLGSNRNQSGWLRLFSVGFERFICCCFPENDRREEELLHGQYNSLLTGAELGSVRPHYNLDLSAELPQPSLWWEGVPPFTCRLILPPASPLCAWCSHPSRVARDRNLCIGRPPNWPCALSIG